MGKISSTPPSRSTRRAPGGPAWRSPSSPPPRTRRRPTPSPLTGPPTASRCLPSPPLPGWTGRLSMYRSRTHPPSPPVPASWMRTTRTSPRSRSPIPAMATRVPSRCSTPKTAWRARAAASSSPSPPMCTSTSCFTRFARRRTSTATSRATSATRTPRPVCCATPSLTIRIPTSRMTRTSLRPLPAKPPSRSPSMRRALLSPSPELPSRWWARTETPSASTPRRSPVPSPSPWWKWATIPSTNGCPRSII